ncbi:hypothetical protein [Gordoniibacillus kamchatkensis]|uniref:hypothetical protein n=1 Tax=Gordoniibacillus kamchatkensis TaxID=1590651 RepID=UPI0006960E7D|nr:hypothetical protein [Paenibacillus sp. VKM B-2647]
MPFTTIIREVEKLFQKKKPEVTANRRNEIVHLKEKLKEFNIQFSNLVDQSSAEERLNLVNIGKSLAQNDAWMNELFIARKLPVDQLLNSHKEISRKLLDDHYQFIISIALIFNGPFPCLKEYIQVSL